MAKVTEKELMELRFKQENGIKLSREEKKILKDNDKEAQEKKKKMSFGERLMSSSASDYAQLMGEDEIDKYPIRDWISTGNVLLNAQISSRYDGGLPSGRIWQLAGINSCGKTFLMLETIKVAQAMGYFAVLYDTEMANNNKEDLKQRGIDLNKLLYIPVDTVESLMTSVLNILDEVGPEDKVIIGIDSIGNISTNKEIDDTQSGSETKDMTRASKLKAFFRTCTMRAGIKNVPIIAINHVYDQIGGFGGKVIGGGSGSLYNASIINEFTKAQEKASNGSTTGGLITSTTTKCRTAKEKTKVKFTIDFEAGLTMYSGLLQFCLDEGVFTKEKQSFKMNPKKVSVDFMKDEVFSKSKLTDEFWKEFLTLWLGDFLRSKFKYMSVKDELNLDDDEEETEEV
jgi:RecA/RadA recombinase